MADEILKALPVPTAMLVAAVLGLWKHTLDLKKENREDRLAAEKRHQEELAAKDAKIADLTKELFRTLKTFSELQEKHERLRANSSSPPPA